MADFIYFFINKKKRRHFLFSAHLPLLQLPAEHYCQPAQFQNFQEPDGKSQRFYGNPLLIRLHIAFLLSPESGNAAGWKQMFVKLMEQRV